MKFINLKFFPLLILLSGPPAFRKMTVESNIISVGVDIWIAIQIIAYLFALFLMIKLKNPKISSKNNIYDLLIAFILISILISSLLSNEIIVSLAYTFLFFIGVFSYYYYKNLFHDLSNENILGIYKLIRNIFFFLLLIVIFLHLFSSGYVSTESRISGGRVANVLIIAPIVFFISLYLIIIGSKELLNKICIFVSLTLIFFAYSRSTWWATIFLTSLLIIKIFYLQYESQLEKIKKKSILYFLIFILFFLIVIYFSDILNFLTRGQANPLSLSGRDLIAYWIFDQMKDSVFGLGIGTGFKRIFPTLIGVFDQYGLDAKNIGTAHNAYLQILISGGWISFLSFILLSVFPVIYFIKNFNKIIKSNFYLLFIIFLFLISNNMVNATSVMPSYLTFGLFWTILSIINLYIYKNK